ncbi:MAG: ribulose-phosphate 3-epimerase [Acidimicrobiales bacterium]
MTPCQPVRIAASMLSSDFARLGEAVVAIERAGADRVHWDVMDGQFVPNLTIGPDVIAAARACSTLGFEAHLMVGDPERLLARWVEAGCAWITVHAEACRHLHRTLGQIAELGAHPGIALNPATAPSTVEHVIGLVDLVLVMTVTPGFSGQTYLAGMEAKIEVISAMVEKAGRPIEVEVDGGISTGTIRPAFAAGARTFVSGSALWQHERGIGAAITEMKSMCGGEE